MPRPTHTPIWNSCLYECRVIHQRRLPAPYRLQHGYFLFCLDLDELPLLTRHLRLFGHNHRRPYQFRDTDHLVVPEPGSLESPPATASTTRDNLRRWVHSQGVALVDDFRIRLVTLPRFLGYVFNPVSWYFLETRDGQLLGAVAEVGNTFGELKPYWIPPDPGRPGRFHRRTPKHFHVSPFSPPDLDFEFHLTLPGDQLDVAVTDLTGDDVILSATLTGTRRPLTDRELLRLTLRYPLVTLRIITLIHWHALRLWCRRVPWFAKTDHTADQRDVLRPHPSLVRARTPSPAGSIPPGG